MAQNGQAKKDFAAILAASAKVKEAETALDAARAELNKAGAAYAAKHGAPVERTIGKGESARKVKSHTVKPIVGEDGLLYDIVERFTENGSSYVVRTRELG